MVGDPDQSIYGWRGANLNNILEFEQDYPGAFEVVFASAQRNDPAIDVARRVAAEYPHVTVRFVLTRENWGLNPKVSNLQGALQAARWLAARPPGRYRLQDLLAG